MPVARSDSGLYVLAAPKSRKSCQRVAIVMNDFPMFIEARPEYHTSIRNDLFGELGKYASGRGVKTNLFVGVDGRINVEGAFRLGLVQNRADLFAQTALDAGRCINDRIAETLLVLVHRDAVPRTPLNTSPTAAARFFIVNIYHRRLFIVRVLNLCTYSLIITLSSASHPIK